MGSFPFLKKSGFFHFLQISKTVKRKFFAESLCGIMHGCLPARPPALGQGGHYYRNQASHSSIYRLVWANPPANRQLLGFVSPCAGRPFSFTICPCLWAPTLTQMGLVVEGCSTEEEKKKKICNNLFIVRPGVCCFYRLVDFILIFSVFFFHFFFPVNTHTHRHIQYSWTLSEIPIK